MTWDGRQNECTMTKKKCPSSREERGARTGEASVPTMDPEFLGELDRSRVAYEAAGIPVR
jgi:hypothetical protein